MADSARCRGVTDEPVDLAEQWDELDAAYHAWIERRIDRVLALTLITGDDLLIAASHVHDIARITPTGRERKRRLREIEKKETGFSE